MSEPPIVYGGTDFEDAKSFIDQLPEHKPGASRDNVMMDAIRWLAEKIQDTRGPTGFVQPGGGGKRF